MKIINFDEAINLLSSEECIPVMRQALQRITEGTSIQYLRTAIRLPESKILGFMPAYLDGQYFGAKIISVFPSNLGTKYPSHLGSVLLFNSKYGVPLALVDGSAITKIRTGAVSAVATDVLARKDAHHVAFIGAGVQARSHLKAIRQIRDITSVSIFDLSTKYANLFAEEIRKDYGIEAKVCNSVHEATLDSDIICTFTSTPNPVIGLNDVKPGAHINAVGACTPRERELTSKLTAAVSFFGDSKESVFHESGDFLTPLQENKITEEHYLGDIGELLEGIKKGRTDDQEITVFEALGLAIEDVAAAKYIYEKSLNQD